MSSCAMTSKTHSSTMSQCKRWQQGKPNGQQLQPSAGANGGRLPHMPAENYKFKLYLVTWNSHKGTAGNVVG